MELLNKWEPVVLTRTLESCNYILDLLVRSQAAEGFKHWNLEQICSWSPWENRLK